MRPRIKALSRVVLLVASGVFVFAFFINVFIAFSKRGIDSSVVAENLHSFREERGVSSLRQRREAPHVPYEKSFSACLLIKDDNSILDEWIAYHYYALHLRYLVVAIDPSSETSPSAIFEKWRDLTDLRIVTWRDVEFMPQDFLDKGYHIPPRYINTDANQSKWHAGNEDAETVRADRLRINNHRFRQVTFLSACLRHVREMNRTLAVHVDTDEYVVVSPMIRQLPQLKDLRIPSIRTPSFILEFIRQIYTDTVLYDRANFPCLSMPRLLFGSVEQHLDNQRSTGPFNATTFETMRWRHHTTYDDKERNAQPKVIVDVSLVDPSDEMFLPKPFSIHRPSKKLCRRIDQMSISSFQRFPLIVNHYMGTYERYSARRDSRRSLRAYEFKAHVDAGRDDWIEDWLVGFVSSVGRESALLLLDRHLAGKVKAAGRSL